LSSKQNVKGQKTLIVSLPGTKIKTLKSKVHKPRDWSVAKERGGSCEGTYCVLIVLVDLNGDQSELPLPSEIHDYIFTNPGRIKNALNEMSYGQMIYDGDVTDWINISSQSTYWGGTITPEMELYMIENSIDLNNYDQITYLVNNPGGPLHNNGVAWTEPGFEDLYVGASQTYYSIAQNRVGFGGWSYRNDLTASGGNLSQFDALYIHEMGHNLGAKHDNSFICKNGAISLPSECIHDEYGNRYSIMGRGGGGFAGHFSTLQKLKIGWLNPDDVPFVSGGNTQITPVESVGAKSVAVDINSDLIPEYVLEKRAYIGIDRPTSKSGIYKTDTALVYKIDAPSYATSDWYSWINHYRLIDVTPPVNEWESWPSFQSATLNSIPLTSLTSNIGQLNGTIVDNNRGINITAIKNLLGGVVNVSSNPSGNSCVHRPIKVFSTGWNSTQFDDQLPYRNWSQSQEPVVYPNLEGIEVDTTDPLAQVPIVINFSVPNNDSPSCPPADYEAKLIFNGEVSGLVATATFEPWTGDNYLYAYTNLLAYGLPYGEHTIVLQVTKLNDGSQVSFDLKFVLEQ
jgi:M6 family metalloprotease-like protein